MLDPRRGQAKVMPRCNSPWSQESLPWSGELAEEVACAANVEARFTELRECVPRPAPYKGGCAHVPGGIRADVLCGKSADERGGVAPQRGSFNLKLRRGGRGKG